MLHASLKSSVTVGLLLRPLCFYKLNTLTMYLSKVLKEDACIMTVYILVSPLPSQSNEHVATVANGHRYMSRTWSEHFLCRTTHQTMH